MANIRLCSIPECDKPHIARGLCNKHYKQLNKDSIQSRQDSVGPCSVHGCGGKCFSIGKRLCAKHYYRVLKNGTVETKGTPPKSTEEFIDNVASVFSGEVCLPWPYSCDRDGYGKASYRGRRGKASRIVCEVVHGDPPTLLHEAAHSCGVASCVNPNHLRWATPKENAEDKKRHGTNLSGENHPNSKLTDEQALAIFSLFKTRPASEISGQFGVSTATVYMIGQRRYWVSVTDGG